MRARAKRRLMTALDIIAEIVTLGLRKRGRARGVAVADTLDHLRNGLPEDRADPTVPDVRGR